MSAWRKGVVGDLTSALFAGTYTTGVATLPTPTLPAQKLGGSCSLVTQDTETEGAAPSVPTNQTMPNQNGGTTPASDVFTTAAVVKRPTRRTVLGPAEPRPVTTKSSYNRLAQRRN